MAIKRLTIELDDSPESQKATTPPTAHQEQEFTEAKKHGLTGTPEYAVAEETTLPEKSGQPPVTFGRTFTDLLSEFANNPRAMATALMIVPFVIFAAKIDSIESIKYPVITGAIFNAMWFGVPIVIGLFRWILRQFKK